MSSVSKSKRETPPKNAKCEPDPLGAKLSGLEKVLASPRPQESVDFTPEEMLPLLREALESDAHWRTAIGCLSYLAARPRLAFGRRSILS